MTRDRLRRAAAIVALVPGFGCSGGDGEPAGPDPPAAGLEVTPDSVTVSALGSTAAVTVRVGGSPATATFTLRSERRWLDDRAVLDAAELQQSRIVASTPGRAVVSVTAGGATDSVIVNVTPARAVVVEARLPGGRTHVGDGDTIVLRGYRMDQVTAGAITAPGVTVQLGRRDSANLGVVVPALASASCAGTAPALTLTFSGLDGSPVTGLTRKRSGELTLAVGEAKRLSDGDASCLRLRPAAGARYLLAYADTRLADQAQAAPEWPWPDTLTVSIEDRSNAPSGPVLHATPSPAAPWPGSGLEALSSLVARHAPPPTPSTMTGTAAGASFAVPAGCPYLNIFFSFCRATPYTLGEAFTYYPQGTQRPAGMARVIGLRDNIALAVFLADSAGLAAGAAARGDSALLVMQQRVIPRLRSIFDLAAATTTSDDSGQLLAMLEQSASSFSQWWPDAATGHGRWGKVTLQLAPNSALGDPAGTAASALLILAHEVTHTYQFRWRFEHASPWQSFLGTGWAVEGGATFLSMEAVREQIGVPFTSNYTLGSYAAEDPRLILQLYAAPVANLTDGYISGASFLRDLAQRLVVEGGLSADDAVREVLVGSMEGWWGINEEGLNAGPGLTARMRQRLGAAWNPANALLDWTLSGAADDLTGNPRYQNLTVRSSAAPTVSTNPVRPHATVGNGVSASVARPPGTTGVFLISESAGGSYIAGAAVRGVPTGALEWLLLRIS